MPRIAASDPPAGGVLPQDEATAALGRELEALREEVALLKARLAEAEELADVDVLAPVLNRRAFMRELKRTIAFVARYGGSASLLYFDLDGFKTVNDRFGHAAGDAALTAAAARLTAHVRESDAVGRLGGDEFGVILTQTDPAAAAAKAYALAAAIAATPVEVPGGQVRLRASVGLREIGGLSSAEQVLAEADADMFLQKPPRDRTAG